MIHHANVLTRADSRAVDLGGPSVYQGAKFESKHKSGCLQKSKFVDWGRGASMSIGGWGAGSFLAPALVSAMQ